MNTYKVTIAEGVTYRQFVGFIEAETKIEAKEKAKKVFMTEKPLYSAKFRIIGCHKVQSYKTKGGER